MSLKVSIITITFNAAATLEDTIQSVLNQSYDNIEYLIIDGKSTDGTLDIISKYKDKISKVISEKDNGLYDAINKGINLATGDVIALLHADDFYIDQDVIKEYAKIFNADNADAVYANLYYVDSNNTNKIIRKWYKYKFRTL